MSDALHTFANTTYPMCVARAQTGEVYMHNGYDRPQRWDGITAATEDSGITAPATAVTAAGAGSGSLTGSYKVYVRFIDDGGVPSNFNATPTELELSDDASVSYTNVPQPTEDRVTQIQIWRNTDGQEITWYLDATVNVGTTTASSTKTDAQLQASTSLRFYTADGYPNAMRFTPPPTTMKIIASFMDRMWFAGTTSIDAASSSSSSSSSTDTSDRNTVMFSEAQEPESVPTDNTLILQEDGDEITGLMPVGPYLYILKRRHIYRLATAGDPRNDASVTLVAERGCLNQRCWCRAEGMSFLLDENGMYLFDGNNAQSIDQPIRDQLTDDTNGVKWSLNSLFSVSKSADSETVKFIVAMGSSASAPRHAFSYHYRLQRWCLDNYAKDVKCSGEAVIDGMGRMVLAADTALKWIDEDDSTLTTGLFSLNATFGEFLLLPIKESNVRRFQIWFEPISAFTITVPESSSSSSSSYTYTHTLTVKLYYDGSTTAEEATITLNNENGVTTTAGAAGYVIDLSNSKGYASFRFDEGMDPDAQTRRTVKFELTGSASRKLVIHRIEIDGVSRV